MAEPGDIPIDLVQFGPMGLIEKIIKVIYMCIIDREIIHKNITSITKQGTKSQCKNYRGICKTSSTGCLYGRIIKTRLVNCTVEMEEHSGFRSGRSYLDNTFTLKQVLHKGMARNLKTHLVFIDMDESL